jgi:hypothetical protein
MMAPTISHPMKETIPNIFPTPDLSKLKTNADGVAERLWQLGSSLRHLA